MIRWMLEQMERSPHAVFYEKDLRERFPEEFQSARAARLLRSVPARLNGGSSSSRPHQTVPGSGRRGFVRRLRRRGPRGRPGIPDDGRSRPLAA